MPGGQCVTNPKLGAIVATGLAPPGRNSWYPPFPRNRRALAIETAYRNYKNPRGSKLVFSGYDDVRALLHVHSSFSHDSRGTIEEILAAAKESQVRVIMFSEHPASSYDYIMDGHRGVQGGVLLIPGAETEGFLAYPRQSIQEQQTASPQAFADLVRVTGGEVFECDLDPYVRSFHHVSTHLLLPEVNEAEVRQALIEGRAYVAFDWLTDPTGFVYQARHGDETWPLGSEVPFREGLRLQAEAPMEGQFKLIRDGKRAFEQVGTAVDYAVRAPGVYRIEVWLRVADEDRPWILTNPIYVRSAN